MCRLRTATEAVVRWQFDCARADDVALQNDKERALATGITERPGGHHESHFYLVELGDDDQHGKGGPRHV